MAAAMALFSTWNLTVFSATAESALLAKVRAGDNVKVVLLGTSLTAAATWPASLQNWLSSEAPSPGTVTVVNRAASGQASDHGVAVQTPLALADNPDAVFIEFTMNDAATTKNITQQQSRDNLNWMINQFVAQNPNVIIVLQTMNNIAADPSPFSPRPELAAYYQIYRDVAMERNAILIDNYPNWLNLFTNNLATWNSYMSDPVHPNPLGQATVLFPKMQEVLGPPTTPPAVPPATSGPMVLFRDDFSGLNSVGLNGTTPDITQGGIKWVADAEYKADGSAASGQTSRRACLVLGDLIDGNCGRPDAFYTLSATLNVPYNASSTVWEAIGFWAGTDFSENFASTNSNGTTWMLRRENSQLRVFRGLKNTNGIAESTASPNNVAGTVDLKIILDLTDWNGASNFGSVAYFAKLATESIYTQIAAGELNSTNSTFRAVGISGGAISADFSFFELTKFSPTPQLASFSYDRATGNALVLLAGIPNTRYKLVRADHLDFTNPDENPLPLTGATVGSLDGGGVITDPGGNATIQFNLGTGPSAFFRVEKFAP